MKIVSTILPSEPLQQKMMNEFPHHDFFFKKGIKEAGNLIREAEVLNTYGEDLNSVLLGEAENLRWINVMSAGLEKLPLKEIAERNILVTNARGIHAVPMAEYTIGMMLSYFKQFEQLMGQQTDRRWNRKLPFGELHGKSLLVLGTGAIGEEIARLAKAFSMKTTGMNRSGNKGCAYFDEYITFDELEEQLPAADVIVSVLPSTAATKGILEYRHFVTMKSDALFINVGRGDLIEEETLLKVLNKREIGHMVLDVFPSEPLSEDNELWTFDNLTITPHISSISEQYLPRAFDLFEQNLRLFEAGAKGKYVNLINPNRGY